MRETYVEDIGVYEIPYSLFVSIIERLRTGVDRKRPIVLEFDGARLELESVPAWSDLRKLKAKAADLTVSVFGGVKRHYFTLTDFYEASIDRHELDSSGKRVRTQKKTVQLVQFYYRTKEILY